MHAIMPLVVQQWVLRPWAIGREGLERGGAGGAHIHLILANGAASFCLSSGTLFRSRHSYGTGAVTLALPRALAPTILRTGAVVDHAPLGCAIKAGLPPHPPPRRCRRRRAADMRVSIFYAYVIVFRLIGCFR